MVGRCFMEHLNVPMGSFLYRNLDNTARMQFYTDDNFVSVINIGKSNVTLGIIKKVKSYGRTKAIKTFL